ncbi:hypothetical protein RHCRD62_110035 [Rhodococcus sp. RD6.2]|nr:hypothetical protein RHCRD62_110035 [Rhodococcus sp. RD6.2]
MPVPDGEVAGHQIAGLDRNADRLLLGRARQFDARLAVRPLRQARAVQALAGCRATPLVRDTLLAQCVPHRIRGLGIRCRGGAAVGEPDLDAAAAAQVAAADVCGSEGGRPHLRRWALWLGAERIRSCRDGVGEVLDERVHGVATLLESRQRTPAAGGGRLYRGPHVARGRRRGDRIGRRQLRHGGGVDLEFATHPHDHGQATREVVDRGCDDHHLTGRGGQRRAGRDRGRHERLHDALQLDESRGNDLRRGRQDARDLCALLGQLYLLGLCLLALGDRGLGGRTRPRRTELGEPEFADGIRGVERRGRDGERLGCAVRGQGSRAERGDEFREGSAEDVEGDHALTPPAASIAAATPWSVPSYSAAVACAAAPIPSSVSARAWSAAVCEPWAVANAARKSPPISPNTGVSGPGPIAAAPIAAPLTPDAIVAAATPYARIPSVTAENPSVAAENSSITPELPLIPYPPFRRVDRMPACTPATPLDAPGCVPVPRR